MCALKVEDGVVAASDLSGAHSPNAKRINGEISRAIVVGSIAFFLGKQAVEQHSHKWTIYVRGLEDEDLSYFIKHVVFTLHPSCSEPVVTVATPPFQVTQTGWGEFQAKLQVVFVDPSERPVETFHLLRLYPVGGAQSSNSALLKKPVVHEVYDEIVFSDPTESFYQTLVKGPPEPIPGALSTGLDQEIVTHFKSFSELQAMGKMQAAQDYVTNEIQKTLKELDQIDEQVAEEKKRPSKPIVAKSKPVDQ